jgi:hypothetical protein
MTQRMTAMAEAQIDFSSRCAPVIAAGTRSATAAPPSVHKYEDTGKASHIFAAAKRRPRGRGNLSLEELRSVANGNWLCAAHADQIDKNDGKDDPPPVLLGWKAAHEFRIARRHCAMLHPLAGSKAST